MSWTLYALHKRYGPVVRIGSNEISVADAREAAISYRVQKGLRKVHRIAFFLWDHCRQSYHYHVLLSLAEQILFRLRPRRHPCRPAHRARVRYLFTIPVLALQDSASAHCSLCPATIFDSPHRYGELRRLSSASYVRSAVAELEQFVDPLSEELLDPLRSACAKGTGNKSSDSDSKATVNLGEMVQFYAQDATGEIGVRTPRRLSTPASSKNIAENSGSSLTSRIFFPFLFLQFGAGFSCIKNGTDGGIADTSPAMLYVALAYVCLSIRLRPCCSHACLSC